jgi:hypothetical protein
MIHTTLDRAVASVTIALATAAQAAVTFSVTVVDTPNNWSPATEAQIVAHVHAAGARWAQWMGGNAVLTVQVRNNASIATGSGRSATSSFVANRDGFAVFEQAAATKARGGPDVNGPAPDIEIDLNPSYVADQLWFDPQPSLRTATVPSNKTDAMSVFIHELGHAICYNGWSTTDPDEIHPFDFRSTWDEHVTAEGPYTAFVGPATTAFTGGPLYVTAGNPYHLGNDEPAPGSELLGELMNGVVFINGTRYDVGKIDRLVMLDTGVTPRCPSDIAGPGVERAPDGELTADDVILFISRFTASNPLADIAGPGPTPNPDGEQTADDIILFVNRFTAGC